MRIFEQIGETVLKHLENKNSWLVLFFLLSLVAVGAWKTTNINMDGNINNPSEVINKLPTTTLATTTTTLLPTSTPTITITPTTLPQTTPPPTTPPPTTAPPTTSPPKTEPPNSSIQENEFKDRQYLLSRQSDPNFKTYYNPVMGVQIIYPSNWSVFESENEGGSVRFISPITNTSNTSQGNLGIDVIDLFEPTNLTEYVNMNIMLSEMIITDYEVIESRETHIGIHPAHKIISTGRQGIFNFKTMEFFVIEDNRVYMLTYFNDESNFNGSLDTVQQMIDTFEIVGVGQAFI